MKRILSIILVCLICVFTFCGCSDIKGCGNENIGFGGYSFYRVHISVGGKELCKEIQSWTDNEIGCEVKLKDGNVLYLSEGTYILIQNECPICNS